MFCFPPHADYKTNLLQIAGEFDKATVISEFDLGKSGFGCPDGCIITDNGFAIFIEGKNHKFKKGIMKLNSKSYEGFNSSINGQFELRWRFMNALLMGNKSVSEREIALCGQLPEKYKETDVFYLSDERLKYPKTDAKNYRRLTDRPLIEDLNELFKNTNLDKTYFLAITSDDSYPDRNDVETIRFFDYKQPGHGINATKKVFHFNINNTMNLLEM